MARPIFWACAALLFLGVPAAAAADWCGAPEQHQRAGQQAPPDKDKKDRGDKPGERAGQQPRLKWWVDPKLRADLQITEQQSAIVEQIWQKTAPGLGESRMQLGKLEEALEQMTRDEKTDEAAIIAQIDKVEQLRADANKRRTLMIYRMNKVLTPDQRAKVRALYERPQPGKRDGSL